MESSTAELWGEKILGKAPCHVQAAYKHTKLNVILITTEQGTLGKQSIRILWQQCTRQAEHKIRIIFMNVRGLPQLNAHHNNEELRRLTTNQMLMCWVNWRKSLGNQRLGERTLTWWETRHIVVSASHNTNDDSNSRQQWGGVSLFSINQAEKLYFQKQK